MMKPVMATTKSSASINRGLGRCRRFGTTGGGSGGSTSSTMGSSIAKILDETTRSFFWLFAQLVSLLRHQKQKKHQSHPQIAQNQLCVICGWLWCCSWLKKESV